MLTSTQRSLKVTYLSAIAACRVCLKWARKDSTKVAIIATQAWQKVSSPTAIARYKVAAGIIGLAALTLIAVGNQTFEAGARFADWCDELVQGCLIEIPNIEDHEDPEAIAAYHEEIAAYALSVGIHVTPDEIIEVERSEAQPGRLILSLIACSWDIPGTPEELQRVQNRKIQEAIAQWVVAHLPEWFKSSITRNYFDFMRSQVA